MRFPEDQMTPWFDLATESPTRPGCYLVGDAFGLLPFPAHWFDGRRWFGARRRPEDYAVPPTEDAELPENFYIQNARWRGLNFNPEAQ